jgi:hypothetical protein
MEGTGKGEAQGVTAPPPPQKKNVLAFAMAAWRDAVNIAKVFREMIAMPLLT